MKKEIKSYDVAISSRVRFARNLADYPFMSKCDPTSASEIIAKVKGALGGGYTATDFSKSDELSSYAAVESHRVSREFAESELPHVLISSKDQTINVMVCEEDHVRLQSILPGLALDEAYKNACEVDDVLCDKLKIAYDDKLGFLTQCPTNIGTGMRASVMLFLPALTRQRKIKQLVPQLSKLGMVIRGIYGEGSDALGCIYQISNQETIGISEENIIAKLSSAIERIIELETEGRKELFEENKDELTDKVYRSLGILKFARSVSSSEFMSLYAELRLGVSLGITDDVELTDLDDLFVRVMPYTLMSNAGKQLDEKQRDAARADLIRNALK